MMDRLFRALDVTRVSLGRSLAVDDDFFLDASFFSQDVRAPKFVLAIQQESKECTSHKPHTESDQVEFDA